MNFKIKEQSSTQVYHEKYETVKDLYLHSRMNLTAIIEKVGLSQKTTANIINEIEEETGLRRINYGNKWKIVKVPRNVNIPVIDEFEDDYINNLDLNKEDLKSKYNLSHHEYLKKAHEVRERTGYGRTGGAHTMLLPIK